MTLENISREVSISSGERNQGLPLPCSIPGDEGSKKARFPGIRTIFSQLNCFASLFQRLTLERFRSIRNVFLLLDWLKQIFGCGLQALGKVGWMSCMIFVVFIIPSHYIRGMYPWFNSFCYHSLLSTPSNGRGLLFRHPFSTPGHS